MMLVLFLPSFIKINLLEPKSNMLVRILEAQFLNGPKVQNIFHESAWSWEAGLRCCFLTSTCIILLWWLCSRTSHIKQGSSHIDTPATGKVLVISWPLCFNRRIQIAFIIWLHDIEANAAGTLPEGPQAGVLNPVN